MKETYSSIKVIVFEDLIQQLTLGTDLNSGEYGCSMLNIEGEVVWTHRSSSYRAWTVRADSIKVYYSSDRDLIVLDMASGTELWRRKSDENISFGVLYGKMLSL